MKKNFIIASFAVLSVFAGCSKVSNETTGKKVSFTVLNEESKTMGMSSISFNSGDELSVFDSNLANNEFTQKEAGSGASKEYEGTISASSTIDYVVYPYKSASTVASDGTITVPIASSYSAANSNSILRGMNLSVGVPDGVSVSLKNVLGIVGVNIPVNVAPNIKNVKLSANEDLIGTVSFKYNGGEPEVTSVADGSKSVDFNIKTDSSTHVPSSGSYYFSVLPGTYTGIKLTITLQSGKTVEMTSSNSLTVARNSRTMLRQLALSDVQSAPSGDLVLSLDFSTNVLYKYDSGVSTAFAGGTTTTPCCGLFDQSGYSYPFVFVGVAVTVSGSSLSPKVSYNATNLALQMTNGGSGMVIPALPGKKLSQFRFSHANSATSSNITKYLIVSNKSGQNGATLYSASPEKAASSTRPAGGDPVLGDWVDVEAAAETPMYLYQTQAKSNTCIRQLELKYVDAE